MKDGENCGKISSGKMHVYYRALVKEMVSRLLKAHHNTSSPQTGANDLLGFVNGHAGEWINGSSERRKTGPISFAHLSLSNCILHSLYSRINICYFRRLKSMRLTRPKSSTTRIIHSAST